MVYYPGTRSRRSENAPAPPSCLLPPPREQISYLDAILGNDNVNVEVVDGSVEIKVPKGCQPETVLRIRGKGAPQLNNASVRILVSTPFNSVWRLHDFCLGKMGKESWMRNHVTGCRQSSVLPRWGLAPFPTPTLVGQSC